MRRITSAGADHAWSADPEEKANVTMKAGW
jgi:hypothetical protein